MTSLLSSFGPATPAAQQGFGFSLENLTTLLSNLRICQTLTVPPELPDSFVAHVGGPDPTKFSEVAAIGASWSKGFSLVIFFLYHAKQEQVSLDDDAAVAGLFQRLFPNREPTIPDAEKANPVHTTVLLILYFNGDVLSGSQQAGGFMRAAGLGGTTPTQFAEDRSIVPGAQNWMATFLGENLFCRQEFVQCFWDMCGRLTRSWIVSHSSAGSAAFNRLIAMCDIFGMRPGGPLKLYVVLFSRGIVPAMSVSYLPNSFAEAELEGRLIINLFFKIALCFEKGQVAIMKHTNYMVDCFKTALTRIPADTAKLAQGSLVRTILSDGARQSMASKIGVAGGKLNVRENWPSISTDIAALNPNVLFFRERPDRQVCNLIAQELGVPDRMPDGAGPELVSGFLSHVSEVFLGNEVELRLFTKRCLGGEVEAIRQRLTFLRPGTPRETAVTKLVDYIMNRSGNLVDVPVDGEIEETSAFSALRAAAGM